MKVSSCLFVPKFQLILSWSWAKIVVIPWILLRSKLCPARLSQTEQKIPFHQLWHPNLVHHHPLLHLRRPKLNKKVFIRSELMSCEFLFIWLDYNPDLRIKPVKIAGFYRVWTQDGSKNTECQLAAIKIFVFWVNF